MVIGLTGKCCSGKNYVASFFVERGFLMLDADVIAHNVLEEKSGEIVSLFGKQILNEEGRIIRKELGKLVFSDENSLRQLEAVIHPGVNLAVKKSIEENRERDIIINAPLLHKSDLMSFCTDFIWVEAPLWLRIQRAMKRDSYSLGQIFKRIWVQRKLTAKYFSSLVDINTVINNGNKNLLLKNIEKILKTNKRG